MLSLNPRHPTPTGDSWAGALQKEDPFSKSSYGWTDIPTTCEFLLDYEEDDEADDPGTGKARRPKKKPWRYRWPDEIRDEVLARLLELNQKRHEDEVARGVAPGKGKNAGSKTQRGKAEDELL